MQTNRGGLRDQGSSQNGDSASSYVKKEPFGHASVATSPLCEEAYPLQLLGNRVNSGNLPKALSATSLTFGGGARNFA